MPTPVPRASVVAWGDVRDALAAVHNLETLLKSPRVGGPVLSGLLPELRQSCAALRVAFAGGSGEGAQGELSTWALERVGRLDRALAHADGHAIDARARLSLEQAVGRTSADLDAAVELLELLERSHAPVPTELALEELARASFGIASGIAQKGEVTVRLDTRGASCVVQADPHVVSRLVAAAVTRLQAGGVTDVTLSARCEGNVATLTAQATEDLKAGLPLVVARLPPRVPPTDAVVEHAARAIGGEVRAEARRVVVTLPSA